MSNTPPIPKGTKIGRFTVLSFVLDKYGARVYSCQCDCGNLRSVKGGKLIAGKSKSCGCLRAELLSLSKRKWPQNPAITSIIAQYRVAARRRNYCWELNQELAAKLLVGPCFWCGMPPGRQVRSRSHTAVVSGIDRKTNDVGYTEANCVSCCKICNIAKSDLTEDEWTEWLERIRNFRQSSS